MGEESVIDYAAYAQPYSSRAAYCGASPGNMQRTRNACLWHFDNARLQDGCYLCEDNPQSARYKLVQAVLNRIKGARQRVSFAS